MFTKLAKHRSFEYKPRYYNPDEEKRKHAGIRIRRQRHHTKSKSLIWMIGLLGFILYMLYFFVDLTR